MAKLLEALAFLISTGTKSGVIMYFVNFNDFDPERVRGWNDFVVEVKTGITSRDHATLVRNFFIGETNELLIRLAKSLGNPFTQSGLPEHPLEDDMVFRVEVRGEGVRDARGQVVYSTTGQSFPCHTDGSGKPVPYDVVLLCCIRQDTTGGDTVLVTLDELIAGLDLDSVRTLREASFPFPFGMGAIISGDGPDTWIRYNAEELYYYARLRGATFSESQKRALTNLENTLSLLVRGRPAFHLAEGECLALDNRRVLHGRTALYPGSRRLLKRVRLYWT